MDRKCTFCGELDKNKLTKSKSHPSGVRPICNSCKWQRYYKNRKIVRDPEKVKIYRERHAKKSKSRYLMCKYGISLDEYNILLEQQDGKCAICGIHESKVDRNLSVDHNHETGKVRGLLCINCNSALGMFKDDYQIILKAVKYLKEAQCQLQTAGLENDL